MSTATLAWCAIAIYVLATIALTVRGAARTRSLASYAVGNRDIPAPLVGLSLTAQLTSVATFVINPGLVFHYGVSGLVGLGLAAALGITIGLLFFSARFRKMGSQVAALTVPQWIGNRYQSRSLRSLFSVLSLGLVAYAVLIVVALSLVLGGLLGLSPAVLVIVITAFVVIYVMVGGANTHATTNAVQAVIMLVVALVLVGTGLPLLWRDGGLIATLAQTDPNLVSITNPSSLYFRNLFEVFICNFVVGVALVCQPHIVSKVLYLEDDRQLRSYLGVAVAAGMVFLAVLVVGLYARTVVAAATPVDQVVPQYIFQAFPPLMQVLISVGILCAGFSTLEGILLALASIFSIDVFPTLTRILGLPDAPSERSALRFGRVGLALVALLTILLARHQLAHPTGGSVAIFAQYGVYLLFTASFLPLACGMFLPRVGAGLVTGGVIAAVVAYLGVATLQLTTMFNNPAFLATCGIAAGWSVIGAGMAVAWVRRAGLPVRSGALGS